MNLRERLASARKTRKLTQVDLAKKLGVSRGTVGGWEAGDHGISKKLLPKVAKELGLSVVELLA